jgi:5-methylcytosine-specific restriction endonuclease McrA
MSGRKRIPETQRRIMLAWRPALCEAQNHRCCYCGLRSDALTFEHVTPLSHGGSNDRSNLVMACEPCNVRRGTMSAYGFAMMRADMLNQARDFEADLKRTRALFREPPIATLADVWPAGPSP